MRYTAMCGRAALPSQSDVVASCGVPLARWERAEDYVARTNVWPGAFVPVLRTGGPDEPAAELTLTSMRWGLLPPGTQEDAALAQDWFRMFNARGETVREKSIFARLVCRRERRCVVLLSGFYEWREESVGKTRLKQPYFVSPPPAEGEAPAVLRCAGIFDVCSQSEEKRPKTSTVAIVTRPGLPQLEWLHDRSPLLLTPQEAEQWLAEGAAYAGLLRAHTEGSAEAAPLRSWPVTTALNSIGNAMEGPECTRECARALVENTGSIAALFAARGAGAAGPRGEAPPPVREPAVSPATARGPLQRTPKKRKPSWDASGQRSLKSFFSGASHGS